METRYALVCDVITPKWNKMKRLRMERAQRNQNVQIMTNLSLVRFFCYQILLFLRSFLTSILVLVLGSLASVILSVFVVFLHFLQKKRKTKNKKFHVHMHMHIGLWHGMAKHLVFNIGICFISIFVRRFQNNMMTESRSRCRTYEMGLMFTMFQI